MNSVDLAQFIYDSFDAQNQYVGLSNDLKCVTLDGNFDLVKLAEEIISRGIK